MARTVVGAWGIDTKLWAIPSHEWVKASRSKLVCATCDRALPTLRGSVSRVPFTYLSEDCWAQFALGCAILHVRLYSALAAYMPKCTVMPCEVAGSTVPFVAVYLPGRAVLRGSGESTEYCLCNACGSVGCISQSPYFLGPPSAAAFFDQVGVLYLSTELDSVVPWGGESGLKPVEIEVRARPAQQDPYEQWLSAPQSVVVEQSRLGYTLIRA